jgi:hypothetical protein
MSEPLTYGWRGVHTDFPHNRRIGANALYVCSPKSSQCQGDRMKVAVAAVHESLVDAVDGSSIGT